MLTSFRSYVLAAIVTLLSSPAWASLKAPGPTTCYLVCQFDEGHVKVIGNGASIPFSFLVPTKPDAGTPEQQTAQICARARDFACKVDINAGSPDSCGAVKVESKGPSFPNANYLDACAS